MKQNLDTLVQKYLQLKPLSDKEAIAARREYARRGGGSRCGSSASSRQANAYRLPERKFRCFREATI